MREKVVELILQGLITKEIAAVLGVSKKKIVNIFKGLQADTKKLIVINGQKHQRALEANKKAKREQRFQFSVDEYVRENPGCKRKALVSFLQSQGFSNKMIERRLASRGRNFTLKLFDSPSHAKAILEYARIGSLFGDKIIEAVKQGANFAELSKLVGKGSDFCAQLILAEFPELVCTVRNNIKQEKRERALKNSKENKRMDRYRRRVLTGEEVSFYKKRLNDGAHLALICREMNTMFGLSEETIVKKAAAVFGKPELYSNSGKGNPMFGVTPNPHSGIGISGWFTTWRGDTILFRSLLELSVFEYLDKQQKEFSIPKIRIPYVFGGKERTYIPDLVIERTVFEIKPKKLVGREDNQAKFQAAKEFCLKYSLRFDLITEETFSLRYPTKAMIDEMIASGQICFSATTEERLQESYDGWRKNIKHW